MKYVKGNFFAAREEKDAEETRRALQRWIDEIANPRTHGTTHRRAIGLFAVEREALRPLPERRYELLVWHKARVHQDSHA